MSARTLQKAIRRAGSQAALARKLRVTQQAVSLWVTRGVPRDRAPQLRKFAA